MFDFENFKKAKNNTELKRLNRILDEDFLIFSEDVIPDELARGLTELVTSSILELEESSETLIIVKTEVGRFSYHERGFLVNELKSIDFSKINSDVIPSLTDFIAKLGRNEGYDILNQLAKNYNYNKIIISSLIIALRMRYGEHH